jgi:hypothetical protein
MRELRHVLMLVTPLIALLGSACERSGTAKRSDAAVDVVADAVTVGPDAKSEWAGGDVTPSPPMDARAVGDMAEDLTFAADASTESTADAFVGPTGVDAIGAAETSTDDEDAPVSTPDGPDAPTIDAPVDAPIASGVDAGSTSNVDAASNPGHFSVVVVPNRMLDLIFMIDNSPSMAMKQDKLRAQFPRLIDALKDPVDGMLPDLRIALLDSDLGTGGAYPNGPCGPNSTNGDKLYGDMGKFQMRGAADCGVTDSSALWLEYAGGRALNYSGDINTVFTCLAGNLGTLGCGEEHTLQSVEFALIANGIGNDAQHELLRPGAYLGMVLLSDEDDCSAATNDGMFGDRDVLRGEAASLRCATRAHACAGVNLADAPAPGYPTIASFTSPFSGCQARTDDCPNPTDGLDATDTSGPTTCSPLKSVRRMADEIKALKSRPAEQIFVAGIFGWPLTEADLMTAIYKIAPIPNPNTADTAHPWVYDSWPICYDPDHPASNPDPDTGLDTEAAAWGATGGLRLSAFIDEFGDNGVKFSICQPDFSAAMSKIGSSLSKKLQNLCVPSRGGRYDTCTAHLLIPDDNWNLVEDPTVVPRCDGMFASDRCYALSTSPSTCPGDSYLVEVRQAGNAQASLPPGTTLAFVCK